MENLKLEKKCENCDENIRASNYKRHIKACRRGRRSREKLDLWIQCEVCKDLFKCGLKNSHFKKECNGKGKRRIPYGNCRECKEKISMSNMKRHEEICGSKHRIRRKVESLNERNGL